MKVYTAENLVDAQRIVDTLLSHGIDCRINGAHLSGAVGELPADFLSVWLADENDYSKARELIKAIEREKLIPRGRDKNCPQCGEQLESQFSHCWQCGALVQQGE